MTKYIKYGVSLSTNQIRNLKKACDAKTEIVIRIPQKNLQGDMYLPLTQTQINKLKKAKNGVQLKLSKSQLEHIEKTGGFLPLLALLPAVLGAVGGLAGGIASAVNSSKQTAEQQRHNMALEKIAQGSGIISNVVAPIPVVGTKLASALRKIGLGQCCVKGIKGAIWGNGIYLERQGEGLFLARAGEGI